MQIRFTDEARYLLIDRNQDGTGIGAIHPAIRGLPNVDIIVRITITYTNNNAANPTEQFVEVFDTPVAPGDWGRSCGYDGTRNCAVFENEEIKLLAPVTTTSPGILTVESVQAFTAPGTNINVVSTFCDVRCVRGVRCRPFETGPVEAGSLGFFTDGVPFGEVVQTGFSSGLCNGGFFGDPHMSGLPGQSFDWSGEDGGWYALLSNEYLQMNVRVTSYLPESFPDRQLITAIALTSKDGHFVMIEVVKPLDLSPSCVVGPRGEPCLAGGALRVTVDGHDVMSYPGTSHFDDSISITALNLPLECQRFGDHKMWVNMPEEQKLTRPGRRSLRASPVSIIEWLLLDPVMVAPPWCQKYLRELDGDVTELEQLHSRHATFRVVMPNLSLRLNVGINSEAEQVLADGRVVPAASFWQMDATVEDAAALRGAKGMLGETARPVLDESGEPVMSGLGVLRGDVEDYRVMHPLGTDFKQLFVPEQ